MHRSTFRMITLACSALALGSGWGHAVAAEPQAAKDPHTVVQWLFDEPNYLRMTLSDAGPNLYDLRLLDPGKLGEGRFGNALHVSGSAGPAVAFANRSRVYDEKGFLSQDSWLIRPPAHLVDLATSQSWTIEFWVKLDQAPEKKATLLELGYPDRPAWHCSYDPQAKAFELRSAEWKDVIHCPAERATLTDGNWHHLAFVRAEQGGAVTLYVDGKPQQKSSSSAATTASESQERQPGLVGAVFENQVASPLGLENAVNVKAAGVVDFFYGESRDLAWREDWRGSVQAPVDGTIEFHVEAQDGARLTIGGNTIIDGWNDSKTRNGNVAMRKGEAQPMRLEFRQAGATRTCRLMWRLPGGDWELVPGEALGHTDKDEREIIGDARNVIANRFYLSLGSGWLYEQPVNAMLDELRISDVARYQGAFTPATLSRNYGPDAPAPTVANGPPLLFDGGRGTDPVALGGRKHVFIDDVLLDARRDVQLKMITPQMDQPTDLRNEHPWENNTPSSFGDSSFYDDDGTIRFMYNHGTMWTGSDENNVYNMATTRDGLHFEKPSFTHIKWEGAESNNIVIRQPVQGRFFKDPNPNAPAAERYKMGAFHMHRGVYLFTSPDGIEWTRNETILAPFDVGGGVEPYWDDQRGSYVAFIRNEGWTDWHAPFGRAVARTESREPFKPWSFEPRPRPSFLSKAWSLPSITTELPTAFAPKDEWNAKPQFFTKEGHVYRSRARKYEWAPDTYVSFHWRLYGIPDKEQRQSELAVSRDGVNWTVYDAPYLPYGVEFEGAKVVESLAMDGLVRRGDELWQYAELRFTGHRSGQFAEDPNRDVMMRYKQRLDGFVALQANERNGWALTRPLVFEGDRLELNVAAKGQVRVALLDEMEVPLPGFTLADCDPIKTDSTHQVVTWGGSSDVRSLSGKTVRVHFEMQQAQLFAVQFCSGTEVAER